MMTRQLAAEALGTAMLLIGVVGPDWRTCWRAAMLPSHFQPTQSPPAARFMSSSPRWSRFPGPFQPRVPPRARIYRHIFGVCPSHVAMFMRFQIVGVVVAQLMLPWLFARVQKMDFEKVGAALLRRTLACAATSPLVR